MKVKPPFPDIEGVTHAFIDTNRTKPGSVRIIKSTFLSLYKLTLLNSRD